MPRDGAIIFGDLIGKLDVLEIRRGGRLGGNRTLANDVCPILYSAVGVD
jgi:hypothetical protein